MIIRNGLNFMHFSTLFLLSTLLILPSAFPIFAQTTTISPAVKVTVVPSGVPGQPINLTVSPVSINLVANPGETVSSQIKIHNNNSEIEYLKLTVLKFTSSTNGSPVIADVTGQDEFAQWLHFNEPEFSLDANEEKTVRFEIAVPKEAALGYYYAIKIQRMQNVEGKSQQTAVEGAPAIPVLLEVRSPHAKRELAITDFTTDKAVYEYLPVTFQVKVKNSGNIHSIPVGDIFIDGSLLGIGQGQKNVASLSFNEGRGNVLPQSERNYFTVWNDGLMVREPKMVDGKATNEYTLKWDFTKGNKLRLGKYTAHLLMVYDNGQRDIPLEATVSFWVIPWKYLGVAVIILFLAFLGLRDTFLKAYKKGRGLFH